MAGLLGPATGSDIELGSTVNWTMDGNGHTRVTLEVLRSNEPFIFFGYQAGGHIDKSIVGRRIYLSDQI